MKDVIFWCGFIFFFIIIIIYPLQFIYIIPKPILLVSINCTGLWNKPKDFKSRMEKSRKSIVVAHTLMAEELYCSQFMAFMSLYTARRESIQTADSKESRIRKTTMMTTHWQKKNCTIPPYVLMCNVGCWLTYYSQTLHAIILMFSTLLSSMNCSATSKILIRKLCDDFIRPHMFACVHSEESTHKKKRKNKQILFFHTLFNLQVSNCLLL